jgi:hypothetical protein
MHSIGVLGSFALERLLLLGFELRVFRGLGWFRGLERSLELLPVGREIAELDWSHIDVTCKA